MTLTRLDFTDALIEAVGKPVDHTNELAWLALSVNEYGSTSDFGAKFNLFDTTQPMPGATPYNSVDVMNYVSFAQGIDATKQTVQNGRYNQALALMGDDFADPVVGAKDILNALMDGGWGGINTNLVDQVQADFDFYANLVVSGGGNVDPPPASQPEDEMQFLAESWDGPATLLYDVATLSAYGVDATQIAFLESLGIKQVAAPLEYRQRFHRIDPAA